MKQPYFSIDLYLCSMPYGIKTIMFDKNGSVIDTENTLELYDIFCCKKSFIHPRIVSNFIHLF